MKKLQFLLVLLVVLQTSFVAAQKVSNIAYRQEQSNIIVSYDLETKTLCKVNLFVSTNGGGIWQGPLTKVTGDVGTKIASGSHSITWNVLEEFEELRGDKIQFQVRADGENIETVVIDNHEWTTKNLNVSKYRNGDIIPEVKDPKKWAKLTTGAWCYYNNDPKNGAIYGRLYNWYAVNDPRGLAPEGFHIPTDMELNRLTYNPIELSGRQYLYSFDNVELGVGFIGRRGGYRFDNGAFGNVRKTAIWWSSSPYGTAAAWGCLANYDIDETYRFNYEKKHGLSVRCIKD